MAFAPVHIPSAAGVAKFSGYNRIGTESLLR
jgi:hypothetical protein